MECKHLSTWLKALHPQMDPFSDEIFSPPSPPLKDVQTPIHSDLSSDFPRSPDSTPTQFRLRKICFSSNIPAQMSQKSSYSHIELSNTASQSLRKYFYSVHLWFQVRILTIAKKPANDPWSLKALMWPPSTYDHSPHSLHASLAGERQASARPSFCPGLSRRWWRSQILQAQS